MNKIILLIICILCLTSYVDAQYVDIDRNSDFTKNKFLRLDPLEKSINKLSDEIKPNIVLKGASDEEEKLILSTFFQIGYEAHNIKWQYLVYPLDDKLNGVTYKNVIITNLRELRELLAILQADDELLSFVQKIISRIRVEDPSNKAEDPLTSKMFDKLVNEELYNFFEDYYGSSYKIYYEFGVWNSSVLRVSETALVYESIYKKDKTEENKKVIAQLRESLRKLLDYSSDYKSSITSLTKPAVSRNLDNLMVIASEMKTSVGSSTVKRIYDHSVNVYYGVVPKQ